jgi:hypothetical protein
MLYVYLLDVVMLNVIMLSVVMHHAFMLSVVMMNVVWLLGCPLQGFSEQPNISGPSRIDCPEQTARRQKL